nr:hypothetical protein [Tanacetum cinerariifolium]
MDHYVSKWTWKTTMMIDAPSVRDLDQPVQVARTQLVRSLETKGTRHKELFEHLMLSAFQVGMLWSIREKAWNRILIALD